MEQTKKKPKSNVPCRTFTRDIEHINRYFSSEKIHNENLWLIYSTFIVEVTALITIIYYSPLAGFLLVGLYTWSVFSRLTNTTQLFIVPRGTFGKLLEFSFIARWVNKYINLCTKTIVPRGTICEKIQSDKINYNSNIQNKTKNPTNEYSTPACWRGRWNNFMLLIISLGIFQSVIAIWQFIIQRSLGLIWLKESLISPDLPGIAKIILDGHKYIRAYGLFPHPNILGGFLLFSILTTLLYKKLLVPRPPRLAEMNAHRREASGMISTNTNNLSGYFSTEKINKYRLWLIYGSLFVQATALMLTFSKSAIIGLLIALIHIDIKTSCSTWNNCNKLAKSFSQTANNKIVPRGTSEEPMSCKKLMIYIKKMFHVEQLKKIILVILIILALTAIVKPNINALLFKSLGERQFYLNVSYVIISNNLLLGVGEGQFIPNIILYTKNTIETWQFQPVHNVFLLIWSELGIIGLGLFILFIFKLFHARLPARQVEQFKKHTCQSIPRHNQVVPRGTIITHMAYIKSYFSLEKIDKAKLWLIYILLFMECAGLITLSYVSPTIGLLLALLYIWVNLLRIKTNQSNQLVPRGTINKVLRYSLIARCTKKSITTKEMIHIVPRPPAGEAGGTISEEHKPEELGSEDRNKAIQNNFILCNSSDELSIECTLIYFQGIFLGFLFIMLFDHYLWDIWPGQALFWLVAGVIAGLKRRC